MNRLNWSEIDLSRIILCLDFSESYSMIVDVDIFCEFFSDFFNQDPIECI